MRRLIYYVAASIDGYISGPEDDISGFVASGNGVDQYLQDLEHFDTVIMGRRTYEFGYKFGLVPGQPAYPHMKHYIFSGTLNFHNSHPGVEVKELNVYEIERIRKLQGSDIYVCGGGMLAGWLLDRQLIHGVKLKLNPLILGKGVRLFGSSEKKHKLEMIESVSCDGGLQIITYDIHY
ncbi:MAG TPA: dihydrofolate reductase family protein [Saprospiraceae bacterium]|nr:dihydrofolate reductase family protein [Saprospiraceae bacterium]